MKKVRLRALMDINLIDTRITRGDVIDVILDKDGYYHYNLIKVFHKNSVMSGNFSVVGLDIDSLGVERVIFNYPATIVFWEDGTKTVVKAMYGDMFNPERGFLQAYFEKTSGLSKTSGNKFLSELSKQYKDSLVIEVKENRDECEADVKENIDKEIAYACPECEDVHTASEWDEATEDFYDEYITSILEEDEGSHFVCPSCNSYILFPSLIRQ